MSVPESRDSMDYIVGVIGSFSRKGIRLWSENGHLHYKAPKGALAPQEVDELRQFRDQIVTLLEAANGVDGAEPELRPRSRLSPAPLTFTQLARWNLYQLGSCHSSTFVPSALRLRGPLNVDALRTCVTELVRRHDALRTRIPIRDGRPVQEVDGPDRFEMEVDDLRAVAEDSREVEVKRRIEMHVFEPVDVAIGPLFRARLLILGDMEYALLLSMHHIISDGSSMRILLHELFAAYSQLTSRGEIYLPVAPLQFADYADWQRRTHKSWARKHVPYWEARTKGYQRLRFPSDKNLPAVTHEGWGRAPFQLDTSLKAELYEWCRKKRTTLVMTVFTAYIALALRWCDTTEAVFLFEIEGRSGKALQSAIGYFAFPLYLPIRISERDSFADLLEQVTDKYCEAHEHADFSFMEVQVPMPQFVRNTVFNWMGRDWGLDLADSGPDGIQVSRIPFEVKMTEVLDLDMEPLVSVIETDGPIEGSVAFPLCRFSANLMESFARSIPVFVKALVRQPSQRLKDIPLRWQIPASLQSRIR